MGHFDRGPSHLADVGAATAVRQALADAAAASTAYRYPDTDNQMEGTVFSFAKREDEGRSWEELLSRAFPGEGAHTRVTGLALDAGCGLGAFVQRLRARFDDVFLVDGDAARALAAARVAGDSALGEHAFALRLDDGCLLSPSLRGSFVFVQCLQVLGHVPRPVARAVMEALAHLVAPGGSLLLAVPFCGSPVDEFWVTFLDPVSGRPKPMPTSGAKYDGLAANPVGLNLPVRHFSMSSLTELVIDAGLGISATQPYHWFDELRGDLHLLAHKPPA